MYSFLAHYLPSVKATAFLQIKLYDAALEEAFYAHYLSLYCLALWVIAIVFLLAGEAVAIEEREAEEWRQAVLQGNILAGGYSAAAAAAEEDAAERKQRLLESNARAKRWAAQRKETISQQTEQVQGTSNRYQQNLQEAIISGTKLMRAVDPQGIFLYPVTDQIAPGYCKVIKKPMCIRSIEEKAADMQYRHLSEFEHDARLIFRNCIKYNNSEESKWFRDEAKHQGKAFDRDILPQVRKQLYSLVSIDHKRIPWYW